MQVDSKLDCIWLRVVESNKPINPPVVDAPYTAQPVMCIGRSATAQNITPNCSDITNISTTNPDGNGHIRISRSCIKGDSGCGVFSLLSGSLVAIQVGVDKKDTVNENQSYDLRSPVIPIYRIIDCNFHLLVLNG